MGFLLQLELRSCRARSVPDHLLTLPPVSLCWVRAAISRFWVSAMPSRSLDTAKRSRLCTLLEEGYTCRYVTDDIGCSLRTVQGFKAKLKLLPNGTIPERKKPPGRPRKTSPRTDALMRRVVDEEPSIIAIQRLLLLRNGPFWQ